MHLVGHGARRFYPAESGKMQPDRINKQLIRLLRTPQMLKKSGINNDVCAEKQSAVRSHGAIGSKEERALIVVS